MWSCTFSRSVSQLCTQPSVPLQPYPFAATACSPSSAALCMSFFGMQPTLTQVPPRPHLEPEKEERSESAVFEQTEHEDGPAGDGFTKSNTATFAPNFWASFEHANPPEPPPMTTRSYVKPWFLS